MKCCNKRDRMKKCLDKNKVNRDSPSYKKYAKYRNTLTTLIRAQKRKYFREQFYKHKSDI
jgi:hypothetical protein